MLAALLCNRHRTVEPTRKRYSERDRQSAIDALLARPVDVEALDVAIATPHHDIRSLVERSREYGIEQDMARSILDEDDEAIAIMLLVMNA